MMILYVLYSSEKNETKVTMANNDDEAGPTAIVFDNGLFLTKVGFGGDGIPRSVFRSIVVRQRRQLGDDDSMQQRHNLVGEDALLELARRRSKEEPGSSTEEIAAMYHHLERRTLLTGEEHSIFITDWDHMERIWHHSFYNELCIDPMTQPILLTEPPCNPKVNRERIIQLVFDTFHVPGMYIIPSPILALYASGRTDGCIVDSGDYVTHIVPIVDGYMIHHGIIRFNIAGSNITDNLFTLLSERRRRCGGDDRHNSPLTTMSEYLFVRDIKESQCYIALDFETEMEQYKNDNDDELVIKKSFELPDGTTLVIGKERFLGPEILFRPNLMIHPLLDNKNNNDMDGGGGGGIGESVFQSIMKCTNDDNLRTDLFQSIVLAGGNTMFPGMADRLSKDITDRIHVVADTTTTTTSSSSSSLNSMTGVVKVVALPERNYMTWIGGSIIADLPTFQSMLITRDEYNETGPSIVHTKCPTEKNEIE